MTYISTLASLSFICFMSLAIFAASHKVNTFLQGILNTDNAILEDNSATKGLHPNTVNEHSAEESNKDTDEQDDTIWKSVTEAYTRKFKQVNCSAIVFEDEFPVGRAVKITGVAWGKNKTLSTGVFYSDGNFEPVKTYDQGLQSDGQEDFGLAVNQNPQNWVPGELAFQVKITVPESSFDMNPQPKIAKESNTEKKKKSKEIQPITNKEKQPITNKEKQPITNSCTLVRSSFDGAIPHQLTDHNCPIKSDDEAFILLLLRTPKGFILQTHGFDHAADKWNSEYYSNFKMQFSEAKKIRVVKVEDASIMGLRYYVSEDVLIAEDKCQNIPVDEGASKKPENLNNSKSATANEKGLKESPSL